MNNINSKEKSLTTLAFIIGITLTDKLNADQQNALGNWLMLIAQTLCTNGSYSFNNNPNTINENSIKEMQDVFNQTINKFM